MKKNLPWVLLGVAALGGGAYWYLKIHKPAHVKPKDTAPPKNTATGFLASLDPTTSAAKAGKGLGGEVNKAISWVGSLF